MNVQPVRHDASLADRFGDPREAGRKGAAVREERRMERLSDTRQAMEARASEVAVLLGAVATGETTANPQQLAAMRDLLDRTVGKAPEVHLDATPSEHLAQIVRMLDEEAWAQEAR